MGILYCWDSIIQDYRHFLKSARLDFRCKSNGAHLPWKVILIFSQAFEEKASVLFPDSGVNNDGDRTVIGQGALHIGAKLSGLNRPSKQQRKPFAESLIERNSQIVPGGADIGRTIAFPR